jgi:FHA domain
MWVTISSPMQPPHAVWFGVGTCIIGRGANCHVVIDDPHVSLRHAQLDVAEGGAWLSDLQSTNGTFVDGRRLSAPVWLAFPFAFHIGHSVVRVTSGEPTALSRPPSVRPSTGVTPTPAITTPAAPRDRTNVADAGPEADGDVVATQIDKADRPWYVRGRLIIVGMGAVAGAGLAMLGLWDRLFPTDVEDVATVTSAEVTRYISLSAFAESASGADVSLTPAPAAMAADLVLHAQALPLPAAATVTPLDTGNPQNTGTPTDTSTPNDTDTPNGTATPTHTATPNDTETIDARLTELGNWQLPDNYLNSVVEQLLLDDDYQVPPKVLYALVPQVIDPNDPDGDPLPAEEVAERLAEDLRRVESQDKNGKKDPLGWVVAVNLDVSGLKEVPLLLTWSLDGLDVPENWAVDNVAYRLTPTTDHDTGSVNVWVPDLQKTGQYNVNLKLARESDAIVISQSKPVPLGNQAAG